jgi:hypothetical protein
MKDNGNDTICDIWTNNTISFEEFQRKSYKKKKNIINGFYGKIDSTDTKKKNKQKKHYKDKH